MHPYSSLTMAQLQQESEILKARFEEYKGRGLKLNMARGVPSPAQLDLSQDMMSCLGGADDCICDGVEARNYGLPEGLPAAKQLFAEILGVNAEQVIVGNNSSLNMMHDMIMRGFCFGFGGCKPWFQQGRVKFICPVPGYDRHFAICENLGIEMIPIRMTPDGPDMDAVRELVKDESVKGMWNIPKYSNPTGYTYSDETVKALASLKPAAKDFRIFWDNAYCVHDLTDEGDRLADIMSLAEAAGNENMVFMFASTSKMSFPGAGIACAVVGKGDLPYVRKLIGIQSICPDKLNQLRHVRYFKDGNGVKEHMKKHAEIIRPKFEAVQNAFTAELEGCGIASWTRPNGGYFISLDVLNGTASRVIGLAAEAGLLLTPAGSTWPYHNDPDDSNIRIAPTYPSVDDIKLAAEIIAVCVKLAAVEKIISAKEC
ncbi:MAG: aminotransferase class I/II-fold pyridoxal phosphate-dependent enzyme [Clostridia bacterium]|nr:aminotransferase class I/II-fold pyridoxal phosphate-dependent enzyme [Clostridia bacterium]